MICNTDESAYVGCLVKCRDLLHEFGIEKLGGLTAAVNDALTDAIESMRCEAEHPGVHVVHKSDRVLRRSPNLEMGPGELITREIVAGAGAVWAAKGPWEVGRDDGSSLLLQAVLAECPRLRQTHDREQRFHSGVRAGVFGRGWEENGNDPDRFDKTLENLGRCYNMVSYPHSRKHSRRMLARHQFYTWLFVQMCKAYKVMRDDHTSTIGRKWNLPADLGCGHVSGPAAIRQPSQPSSAGAR